MSIVGRIIIGGLGAIGLVHCYLSWRSGRTPLMIGAADAKDWGQRRPLHRGATLVALAAFSAVFVLAAIVR